MEPRPASLCSPWCLPAHASCWQGDPPIAVTSASRGVLPSIARSGSAPLRASSQTSPANLMWGAASPRPANSCHVLPTARANVGSRSAKKLAVRAVGSLAMRRRSSKPTQA
eukprot:7861426-Lingulodinium_polyedra.AAC.1